MNVRRILFLLLILLAAARLGFGQNLGWRDDFNASQVDSKRWVVSEGPAPGSSAGNLGSFERSHVYLKNGFLVLKLHQRKNSDGTIISQGAEIYSQELFGYGTYEWRARMATDSSTSWVSGRVYSGTVSGLFVYNTNAQTEVDWEVQGQQPAKLYTVSWLNPRPTTDPRWPEDHEEYSRVVGNLSDEFHVYKFVWLPDRIEFWLDDQILSVHRQKVPSAPARIMVNIWGTNSPNWGGLATPGIDRYLYVDWFSYEPAKALRASQR